MPPLKRGGRNRGFLAQNLPLQNLSLAVLLIRTDLLVDHVLGGFPAKPS